MSGPPSTVGGAIEGFNELLASRAGELGFPAGSLGLKRYQVYVAHELVRAIEEGERFVIVSMPTGSGKTFLEMFVAFYATRRGFGRVLVLEPTRFLCDQMYKRLWSRVFGSDVGKEYEGVCRDFLDSANRMVISTPITAHKCVRSLGESRFFDFVIVDEVHHLFGNRYYLELLGFLRPKVTVGFTALLPSDKLLLAHELEEVLGRPRLLHYDFRRLSEVDPDFKPPLAVADLFEAELSESELEIYSKLLAGGLTKDPRTDKFLERTLVNYGRRALCESYRRFIDRGKIAVSNPVDSFCREFELSHKAKAVLNVVNSYGVDQWQGKLTLVYTGRVETARELYEALRDRLRRSVVELLTGGTSREGRLELLAKLRKGEVSVLVSTRVGEEGMDIPEAKLLVMADIVKSPLKFYQRIGRLIRMGSPEKLKHLVIVLTPRTFEYDNLEEVLWRLYEEGVDVSYIVANIDVAGKTSVDHVVSVVSRVEEYAPVPPSLPLLVYGRELESERVLERISNLIELRDKDPEVQRILEDLATYWDLSPESTEVLEELIFITLVAPYPGSRGFKKRILDRLGVLGIAKSNMYKLLNEAIRRGKLIYIYDINFLANMVAHEILRLYNRCAQRYCENPFFRLDNKEILRLFTHVFTFDRLDKVLEEMGRSVEAYRLEIEKLRGNINIDVWVHAPRWSQQQKAVFSQGRVHISTQERIIDLLVQVNYYDVDQSPIREREKVEELFKLNVEIALQRALLEFLESQVTRSLAS